MISMFTVETKGRSALYACPKGCGWTYAVATDPGPVKSITVSSDMSPEQISAAITDAVAVRDRERAETIERAVLKHVLHYHLAEAPAASDHLTTETLEKIKRLSAISSALYSGLDVGREVTDYQEDTAGELSRELTSLYQDLSS
jgi:hypothetical protein